MAAPYPAARWHQDRPRTLHFDDAHGEETEVILEDGYVILEPMGASCITLSYAQWEALKATILPADGKQ